MADDNTRDQDDIRQRVDQASGGEVVPGLEAEEEASLEASQPRRQPGRPDERSVSTEGRGHREAEDKIREAAEGGEDREDREARED